MFHKENGKHDNQLTSNHKVQIRELYLYGGVTEEGFFFEKK